MIEDQVLFHLPKFGKNIFSLRGFPRPLKGHDKAVRQGPRFGTLKSVSTQGVSTTYSVLCLIIAADRLLLAENKYYA